jgi:hypothetical protein
MKTLLRILLSIVVILAIAFIVVYAIGSTYPVDHTVAVTGTINAKPAAVYDRIADVASGAAWRPEVKSVTVLPPDAGRDHWTEYLGYGDSMTYLATRSQQPAAPTFQGRRDVTIDMPGASYGGAWDYRISPGPEANTTRLTITETGVIHPPIYRFMMHRVFGMSMNLDRYMSDLQAAVYKP